MGEARYRIRQDGMIVSSGDASQASHAALIHGEDGPLVVEVRNSPKGRWKVMLRTNRAGALGAIVRALATPPAPEDGR